MRILVYPHDLNMGGSQTNAIELAAAVTRLGHECVVFGRRGTLCDRIEELGLEFIESPDPGRRPSPRAAAALRQTARSRGIDIIHGYEWPPGLEAMMAAEGLADTAAVCTIMSMAVAPFLPRWLPLIVGTQQISAAEQASGRPNVNLIEPPVDLEHNSVSAADVSRFKAEWGLGEIPVVACVSRLVPELKAEGILTAIEVASDLASTTPYQLLIVGDGKARQSMEQIAARVNHRVGRNAIVFTGELPDPRAAYASADIVLGMGGSALRSLAFRKPLVVQGESGYFRTLTPASADVFRWQGWYGVGEGAHRGPAALAAELSPLLANPVRRAELGAFGRQLVEEFSLERSARRQLTIYRDAFASRATQKRQVLDAGRAFVGLARYHVGQRVARWRGRQRADDFNAKPVATLERPPQARSARTSDGTGPILYFPGVGWDTLAGTDRQLASALSEDCNVVWVDTPHSILRRRDRVLPRISQPLPNVVRLRASTLVGVQRPILRGIANRRRAQVARRYLDAHGLSPRAVIASTTAPMLALADGIPGRRVYYATDDFVAAAGMWGVSRKYLSRSRERNLQAADIVMAVTEDLARHLQRRPSPGLWLPNAADAARFDDIGQVPPADVPLPRPIAGVVGQFNSRTDLSYLDALQRSGMSLLLVGPRWFVSADENKAFDDLAEATGVHWVDELPRDQLAPFLRALDVGLTPYRDSMFNRRSYPLKTVEYLAAGVPVVTTDVAPIGGLDRRHVTVAADLEAFVVEVKASAQRPRDPSQIRDSVRGADWRSRASQLLSWLSERERA